ncbi:hypothetical protein ZHAWSFBX_CDS_0012 [Agrobacterium phage Alfirin]|nr:hypothetical protein ZHAWSFBX_CDS_0012 [Agrobacterium phage Alfirin]
MCLVTRAARRPLSLHTFGPALFRWFHLAHYSRLRQTFASCVIGST